MWLSIATCGWVEGIRRTLVCTHQQPCDLILWSLRRNTCCFLLHSTTLGVTNSSSMSLSHVSVSRVASLLLSKCKTQVLTLLASWLQPTLGSISLWCWLFKDTFKAFVHFLALWSVNDLATHLVANILHYNIIFVNGFALFKIFQNLLNLPN